MHRRVPGGGGRRSDGPPSGHVALALLFDARMSRSKLAALALIVASSAAASAARAQPSVVAPPATPPAGQGWAPLPWRTPPPVVTEQRSWYGWQTLIVDGVSIVTAVAASTPPSRALVGVPIGGAGVLFGGPIVHWAHGHVGKGFASLGILFAASLVGGGIGVGVGCATGFAVRCSEGVVWRMAGFLVGFPVGALVGSAFDVAFLSYERRASLSRPAASFLPALDARRDRLVLGLGGAF